MPDELVVAPAGAGFHIVPLFFYVEFCLWNPIQLRGKEPAIVERSFDANSDIAKRAMCADTREVDYEGFKRRYVEHLNFLVALHGEDVPPIIMSFAKGEYTNGRRFFSLLSNRRKAPLYGCVFECKTGMRARNGYEWYGYELQNPSEESGVDPWVTDKATYEMYREFHMKAHDAFASQTLETRYGDDEEASATVVDESI